MTHNDVLIKWCDKDGDVDKEMMKTAIVKI